MSFDLFLLCLNIHGEEARLINCVSDKSFLVLDLDSLKGLIKKFPQCSSILKHLRYLPDEVTGGDVSCFRLSRTTELVTGDVSETGEPFLVPGWFTLLGGLGADTLRSEKAASLPAYTQKTPIN